METDITVERALELIRAHVSPPGVGRIRATRAHGRVLAEDIPAPMDQPPWPRSPLDGYALRSADVAEAAESNPALLRVVDTVYAGGWCEKEIQPGEAVRIMTGAPIPAGCDCVVRQEDAQRDGGVVRLRRPLRAFENYCFAGDDYHRGDILLRKGTRLTGNAMGVLASAGLLREEIMLPVYQKVRCALICTGDELVPSTVRPLPPGKIYSSNEAVLSARLQELGFEISVVENGFSDDPEALADAIWMAAETTDVYFTTGGVSVGDKDILHETLPLLEADRIFWRVRQKPGTPLMFSVYRRRPVLSLSGNPFAASATFEIFGRAVLAAASGCDDVLPQKASAVLDTPFSKFGKGRRFVRGTYRDGRVTLPEGHSSGQLASAVGTNCLAEIPPSDAPLPAGSAVTVWLL